MHQADVSFDGGDLDCGNGLLLLICKHIRELCTPRAGEIEILTTLPQRFRIGVGVCNQKHNHIESVDEIVGKGEHAI